MKISTVVDKAQNTPTIHSTGIIHRWFLYSYKILMGYRYGKNKQILTIRL